MKKALLFLAVVSTAFCVTFVWGEPNGADFEIDSSPLAKAARTKTPYDAAQVKVLKAVMVKVKDGYVEPDRIVYSKMLLSGLDAIQKSVAPVLVHYEPDAPTFTVQVNDARKEFKATDVNSPWALTTRFEEVFAFLQQHLNEEDVKLRDVEYAAINGMLQTLDPHSVLLSPEDYSEMQLHTRGEFGGLGIVIAIRDGALTVIKPMPGTPAALSGLLAKDRIVKIDEEATLNMPLEEAVGRLRGTPGSHVKVWVLRSGTGGWTKPKAFDLERAVIHIASVESEMLSDNIGLVKVKNFQSNTCDDLHSALAELRRQNMRGLVLDLRDNPGGLLQQSVCISDTFLSSGTIVTTSSNDVEKRDIKLAHAEGTEPNYPMIVLTNGASASASEIVAGALKNHDRALIVGQNTFGKGSVQVLYSDEVEGWALKLTIAQYLTPGDVSIQGVGIVPDIAIDSMTVDRLDMDLTVNKSYLRESDLTAHLTHARAHAAMQPSLVLRYYLPSETRERLREARPEDLEENENEGEFLTRLSRELLARAPRPGRRELLQDAQAVVAQAQQTELARAEAELKKLGVNWSVGEDKGASALRVEVTTNHPDNQAVAGDPLDLKVSITNTGAAPLYQVRAITESDNRLFADRELVFGRVMPGETRQWTTTLGICKDTDGTRSCTLPPTLTARADAVRVKFFEAHGHVPETATIQTAISALKEPQFAYSVLVADNVRGNGDGTVQKGEAVTLYLKVKNVGEGASRETEANLRNLSGRGVLLRDGRFDLGEIKPGEERLVAFTFDVLNDYAEAEAKVELSIFDAVLRASAGEKLSVPIVPAAATPTARAGNVNLKAGGTVYSGPAANSAQLATAQAAGALVSEAELPGWTRVRLADGRPAWVAAASLGGAEQRAVTLADMFQHAPPRLSLDHGSALVTRDASIRVQGEATDTTRVRDLYIFVGSRKVFYQSNHGAANPRQSTINATLPLRGGTNYVTVVVRGSNESITRETFVVRRDGPNGELLETPKTDGELFGEVEEP